MKLFPCLLMLSSLCLSSLLPIARADSDLAALKSGAIIEFIGDSITDGGRARTGTDYNHTMGQDYAFILAATLGDRFAERNLKFYNRGISGNRVWDLQQRWQTDVIELKPDVLTILVGINDTFWSQGETLEQFGKIYDQLLRDTLSALPGIKIILAEPFLLPVGRYREDYPAKLAEVAQRQKVVAALAAKYHLPFIHYQEVFDEALRRAPADHWSWDGVHPHYAGHALMADSWINVVDAARK